MTVFFVWPHGFDLCLLSHAFDGMRRWKLASSLPRTVHGRTPGDVCEPNRSVDDMQSTRGVAEGAYTCWVAIMWVRVQNPKVIGFFYFVDFFASKYENRYLGKNHDKSK